MSLSQGHSNGVSTMPYRIRIEFLAVLSKDGYVGILKLNKVSRLKSKTVIGKMREQLIDLPEAMR